MAQSLRVGRVYRRDTRVLCCAGLQVRAGLWVYLCARECVHVVCVCWFNLHGKSVQVFAGHHRAKSALLKRLSARTAHDYTVLHAAP